MLCEGTDAASCHYECEQYAVQAPTCDEICSNRAGDERAACVQQCEDPPVLICGTPFVNRTLSTGDSIALVLVVATTIAIFGAGAYVTLDYLSYVHP